MKRSSGLAGARHRRQPRFVEPLEDRRLLAAVLVKDINLTGAGSSPTGLVEYRGQVYFGARDVEHGVELWRTTPGAPGDAELFLDLVPGPDNSHPEPVTVFNDRLILRTPGPVWPGELWSTDGTAAGTIKLADIGLDLTEAPVEIDGTLYMNADSAQKGGELWKTDGTPEGTVLVKDILPGAGISDPSGLTNVNGTLFFVANDGSPNHGAELWKSDGTPEGTVLVKDVRVGGASSGPHELAAAASVLLFTAHDGTQHRLWKSDGTVAGTVPVAVPGAMGIAPVTELTPLSDGSVLFVDVTQDGYQLFKSDGTTTTAVGEPSPGPQKSLTRVGDRVFYESGAGLWVTDGTTANTHLVAEFTPGTTGAALHHLTDVNGVLYFTAQDATGFGLWTSDGTAPGTRLLRRIPNPGALDFTAASPTGPVYFHTDDPAIGRELWRTDGTTESTTLARDINLGTLHSSPGGYPGGSPGFFRFGDVAYFPAAPTDGRTFSMWQTDGTELGTIPAPHIGTPLGVFQDKLVVLRSDEQYGAELWLSDGSPAGTVLLKDTLPGPANGISTIPGVGLTIADDRLFFQGKRSVSTGWSLWTSDGTTAGTTKLKDFAFTYQNPSTAMLGDTLLFVAGDRLWTSDGTPGGTRPISGTDNVPGGPAVSGGFEVLDGVAYFVGTTSGLDRELWRTDGTEAGTFRVKDINPGPDASMVSSFNNHVMSEFMQAIGGRLFFIANDGTHGQELWVSDGTESGTRLVKDTNPGPAGTSYYSGSAYGRLGDLAFYKLNDGVHGEELWRSDGTEAGTFMLKDITTGTGPSGLYHLTDVDGTLYFTNWIDVWRTDGTVGNTVKVTGAGTLSNIRRPEHLIEWNGGLLFAAESAATGIELFKIERPTADAGTSYAVAAGGVVTLDGTGSSDPDPNETLTYAWDLDGDDVFGEDGPDAARGDERGASPTFRADGLAGGTYAVTLRVTNSAGMRHEDGASVLVTDPAAPRTITGTDGDDHWTIRSVDADHVGVWVGGRGESDPPDYQFHVAEVTSLHFVGLGGDDQLALSSGTHVPFTFDGGDGTDRVVTSGSDMRGSGTWETLDVYHSGFTVHADSVVDGVNVESGGYVTLAPGGNVTLRTRSVTLGQQDDLDLNDNTLIVEGGDLTTVEALVARGRNGTVRWEGPGIRSGLAAANPLTGLAVAQVGDDVLVKYAWNGDANLDGRINADDYFRIDQGFLSQPQDALFAQGDFNYDDRINADDYFLIDLAFLGQGAAASAEADAGAALASTSALEDGIVEKRRPARERPRDNVWQTQRPRPRGGRTK